VDAGGAACIVAVVSAGGAVTGGDNGTSLVAGGGGDGSGGGLSAVPRSPGSGDTSFCAAAVFGSIDRTCAPSGAASMVSPAISHPAMVLCIEMSPSRTRLVRVRIYRACRCNELRGDLSRFRGGTIKSGVGVQVAARLPAPLPLAIAFGVLPLETWVSG